MSKSFLKKTLQGFHTYLPGEQPPNGEDWVKLNTSESALSPHPGCSRRSGPQSSWNLPAETPQRRVADALREQHILVRRYDFDPIAGWLRITVGTRQQHERLLAALKEILV